MWPIKSGVFKGPGCFDNRSRFMRLFRPSIDWSITDGRADIPIEERSPDEVEICRGIRGRKIRKSTCYARSSAALNYGFDVTPGPSHHGFDHGTRHLCAGGKSLLRLFPEKDSSGVFILSRGLVWT